MSYRWLFVLGGLAIVVSILLVYAENRVYEPATPFEGGIGDHVHAFALDPLHNNHIYVGTHYGFFRTTDGGANWMRLNGQGGISAALVATSLSISPIDGKTVYVTGYELGSGNASGVFVTHDDGDHWSSLPTGGAGHLPDPRLLFVAAGWSQPGEGYAYSIDYGLYRTLDRGEHWQQVAQPFAGQVTTFVPMLACDDPSQMVMTGPNCPERFLVGTTQGLLVGSVAGSGLTFAPVSSITGFIYAVAAHRGAQPSVYVSTDQGLFSASDPAASFTQVASVANGAPTLTSLAVSGADPLQLFGVTQQNVVQRSKDGGKTWVAIGTSLLTRGLSQLTSGLRSATGSNTPQWAGGQNKFLSLLQAPTGDSTQVYAAISFPVEMFTSSDDGNIWTDVNRSGS
jgi:photosystem II stability/assembly factor-like uncharacterized protein